jgi:UDP-sugar transporter A1/2/3
MNKLVLGLLVIQNTVSTLVLRLSRIDSDVKYLSSVAVTLSEAFKFFISSLLYRQSGKFSHLLEEAFGTDSEYEKILIPVVLYFVQNQLIYACITLLDPVTFQVTYQMKILTTALFSMILLKKSIGFRQWISLFSLFIVFIDCNHRAYHWYKFQVFPQISIQKLPFTDSFLLSWRRSCQVSRRLIMNTF